MQDRRIYTVDEIAEIFRVGKRVIYEAVASGEIKKLNEKGKILVTERELARILQVGFRNIN